jgi:hypothetical protein
MKKLNHHFGLKYEKTRTTSSHQAIRRFKDPFFAVGKALRFIDALATLVYDRKKTYMEGWWHPSRYSSCSAFLFILLFLIKI